ncbi:MAG: hypothetical protein WC615_04915 [Mucilaginibacter sp.]|jgi:hypothetical protein|uniref:hypothetical protein n=1 Tax=Mucilaginibacter sp. TaxID=1882438 RepID=UPI003567687F
MDIELSKKKPREVCGIIIPISNTDGYPLGQWEDVLNILMEVIDLAGFDGKVVSDSKVSNIIHGEIVKNLYSNPIVICDVSSKNPNVMFELGLRLAFDKPTIVIKDDATDYNFDTSPIRHISYPKDLRHTKIIQFKKELKAALIATYRAFEDGTYKTFLQSFTEYKPTITVQDIDLKDYVIQGFDEIKRELQQVYNNVGLRPTLDGVKDNPVLLVRIKHTKKTGKAMSDHVKKIVDKNLSTFDRWYVNTTSDGEILITLKAPEHSLTQLIKALQADDDLTVTTAYF